MAVRHRHAQQRPQNDLLDERNVLDALSKPPSHRSARRVVFRRRPIQAVPHLPAFRLAYTATRERSNREPLVHEQEYDFDRLGRHYNYGHNFPRSKPHFMEQRHVLDALDPSAGKEKSPASLRGSSVVLNPYELLELEAETDVRTGVRNVDGRIRLIRFLVAKESEFDVERHVRAERERTTNVVTEDVVRQLVAAARRYASEREASGSVALDVRIVVRAAEPREAVLIEIGKLLEARADVVELRIAVVTRLPQIADADVDARIQNLQAQTCIELVVANRERRNERLELSTDCGDAARIAVRSATRQSRSAQRSRNCTGCAGEVRRNALVVRIVELTIVALDHPRQAGDVEFPRAMDAIREAAVGVRAGVARAELVIDLRRDDVVAGNERRNLRRGNRCGGCGRRGRRRRRGGRRRRRRRRQIADYHDAAVRNPLYVRAHAFRNYADRDHDVTLIDLRRNVQGTSFAVDDHFRFTNRHFYVRTRLGDVNRLAAGVVRNRCAHLFEHRAQRDEDGTATHQRGQDAALFELVRLCVDVVVVEEDRNLSRWRRAEVCRRHCRRGRSRWRWRCHRRCRRGT